MSVDKAHSIMIYYPLPISATNMENTIINIRLDRPQIPVDGSCGLSCASVFAYIDS